MVNGHIIQIHQLIVMATLSNYFSLMKYYIKQNIHTNMSTVWRMNYPLKGDKSSCGRLLLSSEAMIFSDMHDRSEMHRMVGGHNRYTVTDNPMLATYHMDKLTPEEWDSWNAGVMTGKIWLQHFGIDQAKQMAAASYSPILYWSLGLEWAIQSESPDFDAVNFGKI